MPSIKELYDEHGFFSLVFEKMEDWEWYTDLPCKALMIHLIIKCMKQDTRYAGEIVRRGQYRTSLHRLADETGLSIKQIRNAMKKLEDTEEIKAAKSRAKQRTIITLCNFEKYQPEILERGKGKGKARAKVGQSNKEESSNTTYGSKYREDYRPEWFPQDLWIDFMKNRKQKKLSDSDRALATICNSFQSGVEAGYNLEDCVNMYISTRWTRFDHEWMKPKGNGRTLTQKEKDNEQREKIAASLNRRSSNGNDGFMGRFFQGQETDGRRDKNPGRVLVPDSRRKEGNGG